MTTVLERPRVRRGQIRGQVELWRGGWLDADAAIHDAELLACVPNLVINGFYTRAAAWAAQNVQNGGTAVNPPGYLAIGIGSSPALAMSDTALKIELGRVPITSASNPSTYVARLAGAFTTGTNNIPNATWALTEAGLFDAASTVGSMTSATASTMTDSGASWTTNQWAGYTINLQSSSIAQSSVIQSNTATTLTIVPNWTTIPTSGNHYLIGGSVQAVGTYMYAHAALSASWPSTTESIAVIWTLTWPSF